MTLFPGATLVYNLMLSWQPAGSKSQGGHVGEREMCRDQETCLLWRDPLKARRGPVPCIVAPSALGCVPPSQDTGCHLGGITFQDSEVEFRTMLGSWVEPCFLPRQNWRYTGRFSFVRRDFNHFIAAEMFWMSKPQRPRFSLSLFLIAYIF